MCQEIRNVLVITASIGAGHSRAAEAVGDQIRRRYPETQVHIVDFMSAKTAYLNGILKGSYLKMLNFAPGMYDFLYNFSSGRLSGLSIQNMLALAMKSDMESLVREYAADMVICTHPFPCAAAAYLKENGRISSILIGTITDFAIHQLWVYPAVDMYFVANAQLAAELEQRGVAASRIYDTGIPISSIFNERFERQEILRRFSFTEELPIVLVMGGGLGMGGVLAAVEQLEKVERQMQIIVVTGENHALWDNINRRIANSHHKMCVLGFSHVVQDCMAVADLLISKPGALTVSEAMAMELPMLLHEPIPGQERANAAYIEKIGAGVWVKNSTDIPAEVDRLFSQPELRQQMRQQAHKYKRPDSAREAVDCIVQYLELRQKNNPAS